MSGPFTTEPERPPPGRVEASTQTGKGEARRIRSVTHGSLLTQAKASGLNGVDLCHKQGTLAGSSPERGSAKKEGVSDGSGVLCTA